MTEHKIVASTQPPPKQKYDSIKNLETYETTGRLQINYFRSIFECTVDAW